MKCKWCKSNNTYKGTYKFEEEILEGWICKDCKSFSNKECIIPNFTPPIIHTTNNIKNWKL